MHRFRMTTGEASDDAFINGIKDRESAQTDITQRNPQLPVELSGVFELRASTR